MLLNILECSGQLPHQRMMWSPIAIAKVKKLPLKLTSLFPMLLEASWELPYFCIFPLPRVSFSRVFSLVTFPLKFSAHVGLKQEKP